MLRVSDINTWLAAHRIDPASSVLSQSSVVSMTHTVHRRRKFEVGPRADRCGPAAGAL
jgi:hypothetical protein